MSFMNRGSVKECLRFSRVLWAYMRVLYVRLERRLGGFTIERKSTWGYLEITNDGEAGAKRLKVRCPGRNFGIVVPCAMLNMIADLTLAKNLSHRVFIYSSSMASECKPVADYNKTKDSESKLLDTDINEFPVLAAETLGPWVLQFFKHDAGGGAFPIPHRQGDANHHVLVHAPPPGGGGAGAVPSE